MSRKAYPSNVTDDEWAFVAPYLTLMSENAPQREHSLREVFNGLRWIVRAGASWRMLPHDLPPWEAVYQQMQRWIRAGVFEAMIHDLLRVAAGRNEQPSASILDSRTLQWTPESGGRAGYDGAKRKKGSKIHAAVDTLGLLLTLHGTPADEQDRAQVAQLGERLQEVTGENVVERSFAWMGRFRRLAREYERLAQTLVGLHFLAFAILMLKRFVTLVHQSA
jgi:transposase